MDPMVFPQAAKAQAGNVIKLEVTTRESQTDKAMLNVRLSLPEQPMVVVGPNGETGFLGGGIVEEFQMGLN